MFRACILLLVVACQSTTPTDKKAPADDKPVEKKADAPVKAEPAKKADLRKVSFDDAKVDAIPDGFTAAETNSAGTPAKWGVVAEPSAPSQPNAFGVLETKNAGQTYNVALLAGEPVTDAELSVMVKAVAGTKDQGGGVVFRAQGPGDYYIARWNPIEKNVKFFAVEAQNRTELAKADTPDADPKTWHTLRVMVEGDRFEMFLDDDSVLQVQDARLTKAGGVGLWTKADAATLFDDLTITPL
jgi:hypothetical protein